MASNTYNPNPIDQTTHAVFIPEVWSDKTIEFRKKKFGMADRVSRWDEDVKNYGDTIHIGNISELSAQSVTSGTELTFQKPTETEQTLLIDQWYAVPISRVDILKVQSRIDLMAKYTKGAGYALGKNIDTFLHNLVKAATLASDNEINAAGGVTDDDIVNAMTVLDNGDVDDENRTWVFHPRAFGDLRKLTKFSEYISTGKTGLAAGGNNGMVYEVYGVPTFKSTNVAQTAGGQDINILFQKDSIGLAVQKSVTYETDRNIHYLADELVASQIYGGKVLRTDGIVRVLRDTTLQQLCKSTDRGTR